MHKSLGEKIWTVAALAAIVSVLAAGLAFAWPDIMRASSLRERDAELAAKIEAKRREIMELAENQRRFKTDRDFVEAIARRNKRVYPGELVFVFED